MGDTKVDIGDKVIALVDSPKFKDEKKNASIQERIKGKEYIVKHIITCPNCETDLYNLGDKGGEKYPMVLCTCGNEGVAYGMKWTDSIHFIKDSIDGYKQGIEHCLETEDYEFASILRDKCNSA